MISLYTAKSQEQDEQGAFRPEQVMVLVPKMTAERAAWLKESDHSLSAWW